VLRFPESRFEILLTSLLGALTVMLIAALIWANWRLDEAERMLNEAKVTEQLLRDSARVIATPVEPEPSVAEPPEPVMEPVGEQIYRRAVTISGFTATIDLNNPIAPQRQQLWNRFVAAELEPVLLPDQSGKIYLVYYNHDPIEKRVKALIGYAAAMDVEIPYGIAQVQIAPGPYLKFSGINVEQYWPLPDFFLPHQPIRPDYEVYRQADDDEAKWQVTSYFGHLESLR